ncbi:hypothetical protein [Rhodobaculum claviforme]|uniref:Uncharacterized protein n=1 Tax=Rhodobaculum claviforme TaxID=1549854 RepID=A0A934TKE8_9RHOB|nr:hypothetical protein [Rhodobaculum claviforme]MBK5926847.1 hypothetical protein [Rhodobaculum claviforme]
MTQGKDVIARHQGYSRAVKAAWECSGDGLAKAAAGQHLERADIAALSGNEVDFLLEIHRAEQVLQENIDRNRSTAGDQVNEARPQAASSL